MKNIKLCLGLAAFLMIMSCEKKAETPTEVNNTTETTTVEKTVVVDTVAAKQPEDNDGTSVKVGSDGVEIKSKDGEKNTSVEIKK